MVDADVLKDILATAVYAPSGDNSQPWRFVCGQDSITIFNVAEGDATLYNFRQRGSYVGHGALIENIVIASSRLGFDTNIQYFPTKPLCVAHIALSSREPRKEPLYDSIKTRASNRKPYQQKRFSSIHRDEISNSMRRFSSVTLKWVEQPWQITALASAVSVNERLLMENRTLHDFLFGMIRWSDAEEKAKPGIHVKTMEFPPPVQLVLKYIVCHWSTLTWLNKIGFSKMIPKQSAAGYVASSAMGAIIIENDDDVSYVEAGRALQRIWLTATRLALSIQPVTAIPYLAARLEAGEGDMFTPEHQDLIRGANDTISRIFQLGSGRRIAMLLRIGYDGEPSARAYKLPPVIIMEHI